jgi:hypothetical protein
MIRKRPNQKLLMLETKRFSELRYKEFTKQYCRASRQLGQNA